MDANKFKYGKYDLVSPWSLEEMRLHYENGKPFKQVGICDVSCFLSLSPSPFLSLSPSLLPI